jgi:transposase-like protein
MGRIPPSRKMKQDIDVLLSGTEGQEHPLDSFIRMGARYMLQVALEQEIEDFLGRGYYQRGSRTEKGWRNGYEPGKVKTAEGILELALPQLRANESSFRSRIFSELKGKSGVLGQLITGMYVMGLSTRDIEDTFSEALGEDVISRSGVSRVTSQLQKDFDEWRKRDLSDLRLVYLFLDAIYLAVRQGVGREKEAVMCAYGILEDGKKVLLHLSLGSSESYDGWLSFLHDMVSRGLGEPLLVISDKNKGLKRAVREVFPHAFKQPCLAHKMRNILCKVPKKMQKEMKHLVQQVYYASSYKEGLRLGQALIARFGSRYSSAMECLEEDLEECLTYLRFPQAHWKVIRTTNLLERTFGEGKRRTKVIPRFPSERACLKLVYATLIATSQRWKGVKMTANIWWELETLRRETFGEGNSEADRELVAA